MLRENKYRNRLFRQGAEPLSEEDFKNICLGWCHLVSCAGDRGWFRSPTNPIFLRLFLLFFIHRIKK